MTKNELTALKKSRGAEMRAAIIALKYQLVRLQSLPGLHGRFNFALVGLGSDAGGVGGAR